MISRYEAQYNGNKRYYDGTKCDYGHDSERYTSSGECIICVKYFDRSEIHEEKISNRHNESTKMRLIEKRKDVNFRKRENVRRRKRNKNPEIRKSNYEREKAYNTSEKGSFVKDCKTRLHQALITPKLDKLRKCDNINGYTYTEIINHIEEYMIGGMNWDNYGTLWNVSYRIPPSRLYDEGIRDIKDVNNLLNLRPVFCNDSPKKRTKAEKEYFEMYPDIANQYPNMPDFKYK